MIERVLLVYKDEEIRQGKTCVKVRELLEKNFPQVSYANAQHLNARIFDNAEIVISVGGDGTFLRVAQLTSLPIIGVNFDPRVSEGRLLMFDLKSFSKKLPDIARGDFDVDLLPSIEISVNGYKLHYHAVNDVYIGSSHPHRSSKYVIAYRGKKEEQLSSGIIVATATGSYAWYLSAGGKPFNAKNELRFIVREPYFGRLHKPKILHGTIKKGEKLKIIARNFDGLIALDSNTEFPFRYYREKGKADIAEIGLGKHYVKRVLP